MRCIWATSLELTWGVYILREVVANMRNWVYDRVKPEICRWIAHVRLHPDGDQLKQRKRAKSLEQRNERVEESDEDDSERDAGDSDDEGSYVSSDVATSDDDGYTTVEEENYDTSTDEDEPDEGYSSDRFYKSSNRPRCVN
jgi:hypothetical protein